MRKLLLAICFCPVFAFGQWKYRTIEQIAYREKAPNAYAQERCKLDVYAPEGQKDLPVVIYFHGGGLEGGNKHIPNELKESGYVVVSPNYRYVTKAPIDDVLDDAAAAVAWAYKHAEDYGGNHRRIFLTGHSAGGYLTMMVGLNRSLLKKYDVEADSLAALIPLSGQCVTHYNVRRTQGIGPLQPTIDKYAPLSHLRADAPPMVIISGDRELELYGRYEEQAYFWRMLKLVGHPDVRLYEMQGYDHGAMPAPAFHILKNLIKEKK